MFRLLLIPACALLVACGGSPHKAAANYPATGSIIALSDTTLRVGSTDTVRFGRMHSGEIAVKQLRLRNDSSKPIVILTYRRSCGCTSLEYENQPIAPGQELPATLRFDSRGEYGWQLRTLDIILAGAKNPLRIFVEAEVE